jgi:transposase InsO family protein
VGQLHLDEPQPYAELLAKDAKEGRGALIPLRGDLVEDMRHWLDEKLEALRDEVLHRKLFLSLPEARYVLDESRQEYNQPRPHSALNWRTPAAYAAASAGPSVGALPLSPDQPGIDRQPILL